MKLASEERKNKSIKLTVERVDEEGNMTTDVFTEKDLIIFSAIVDPKSQKDNPAVQAHTFMVGNNSSMMMGFAENLIEDIQEKILAKRNSFGDLLRMIRGILGEVDDDDEHEHKCEGCGALDRCDLPPAIEYKASKQH